MNKKAVYAIAIVMLLPIVGYFALKYYGNNAVVMPRHYIYDSTTSVTVNGKEVIDTAWHKIPDFELTNQLGRKVGWKDMEGKVVIADFFFTHCPSICPRMTLNMKKMQDGITNSEKAGSRQAEFLQFLSFSVDPERDSVAELKKWADRFGVNPESWWLLTGPKKEIYDLSIEHMKLGLVDGKGIDTGFFHTDYMVLIDKHRNIRGYYHGLDTNAIDQLSRDIVLLALEKDPQRKKFYEGNLEMIAMVFLFTIIGIGLLVYFLKKEKKRDDIRDNEKR